MALVYMALCALVLVLRWTAGWREGRSKRRYARHEERFRAAERDCKAEEVRVGRPAGYADQIRLLNAFEARDRRQRLAAEGPGMVREAASLSGSARFIHVRAC
jgi:hypothetical protein